MVSDYPSRASTILGSSDVCPRHFSEGTRFSLLSPGAFHTFGLLPRRHTITTHHLTLTQKSLLMESLSRAKHTPKLGEVPFPRASPHSPIEMTPPWLLYPQKTIFLIYGALQKESYSETHRKRADASRNDGRRRETQFY